MVSQTAKSSKHCCHTFSHLESRRRATLSAKVRSFAEVVRAADSGASLEASFLIALLLARSVRCMALGSLSCSLVSGLSSFGQLFFPGCPVRLGSLFPRLSDAVVWRRVVHRQTLGRDSSSC